MHAPESLLLGRPPDDLCAVLARLALGGPAVCALRSLRRTAPGLAWDDLALLDAAATVGADVLVIATDVPQAVRGFGTPAAEPIGTVTVSQMTAYAAEGHFASGSMGPKVDAVCRFVRAAGKPAVITDLAHITDAVAGLAGTVVVPD